jgi:hypothetical protein
MDKKPYKIKYLFIRSSETVAGVEAYSIECTHSYCDIVFRGHGRD